MKRATKAKRKIDLSKWTFTEKEKDAALREFSFDVRSLDRIANGDDWSRVVQAHLYFDHVVTKMLEEALERPEKIDLDRVSFAAKLDLCAAMGLVDAQVTSMLRAINKLRNRLAHDLTFQVSDTDVEKLYSLASKYERELIDEQHVVYPSRALLYRVLGTVLIVLDIRRQSIAEHRRKRAEAFENAREVLKRLCPAPSSPGQGH